MSVKTVKKKNAKNWYLLLKGRESGPFDYYQVLEKISSGEASSFDYIKALNQEEWGALSDHEIFSESSAVTELKKFDNILPILDEKRRHLRSPLIADVFIKKDNDLVKGRAVEVGKGGMGIEAHEGFGEEGAIVSLYCSPISESIAFSCHARIVSKHKISKNIYKYGVHFLKVSSKGEVFIYKILDEIKKIKEAS